MSNFRKLSDTMLASPQLSAAEVAEAGEQGVTLIINNRPDGESPDEPQGADIEAAAKSAGIGYLAIPITHAGFSQPQVEALAEALETSTGKVLGYCRTGTRSTLLWALAQASRGEAPQTIAAAAAEAGYDVSPVRPAMDMFAGQASD